MSLLGVSTIELAEVADVSRPTISSWRNAKADPDLVPLLRAEHYLGFEPGELASYIDLGDVTLAAKADMFQTRKIARPERAAEIDEIIDDAEGDR